MSLQSLTCPCGETSSDFIYSSNVGETKARSGFGFVLTSCAGVVWLCPSCAKRVDVAWSEIVAVVGRDDVHVGGTGCKVSP